MKTYITKSITNSHAGLSATLEEENTPQQYIEFFFDDNQLDSLTYENLAQLRQEMITKYDLDESTPMMHVFDVSEYQTPEETINTFNALNEVCHCTFEVDEQGHIHSHDEVDLCFFS